jgi:hypothetical protein
VATWFSIPDLQPRVIAATRYNTKVFPTDGGTSIRRRVWSSPIHDYRLVYAGLRTGVTVNAPGQGYHGFTEPLALKWLFDTAAGAFGVHTFTEPASLGGQTRSVRFVDDSLEFEDDEGAPWWRVAVTLTTEI